MSSDIAVFVDLDNLVIAAKQGNLTFDINVVLKHLKKVTKGRIVLRKAYGDWRQTQGMPEQLAAAGFELQSTVRLNNIVKNLADMQMVVDAMDTLVDGHNFSTYVLLTGDRDFTPLVQALRKRGKVVIGLGVKRAASRSLVHLCDHYVFYEELVSGNSKKASTESKKRSQPKPAGKPQEEKVIATADEELNTIYRSQLKKKGLRIVPSEMRLLILKGLVIYFEKTKEGRWGEVIQAIYDHYKDVQANKPSKNAINDVLLAAKRARIISVSRGKTLSTAPIGLLLEGDRKFQEAVLKCDAVYLQEIKSLNYAFDIEQASLALYDSTGHVRYLKVLQSRYSEGKSKGNS